MAEKDRSAKEEKSCICSASANSRNSSRLQEISVREQIRDAVQHREMHAEERTVRYMQQVQKGKPVRTERQLRQVRVRRELTGQRDRYAQRKTGSDREPYAQRDRLRHREWYAQKDRLRQQDVPAEREDRYVRRKKMKDHSVRQ